MRLTRDRDRGRATDEEVERGYRRAESAVVALERRLGFHSISAGMLRSDDPFRAFAHAWEGVQIGPLTRWLESNTFYRRPILLHPPVRRPGAFRTTLPPPVLDDPSGSRILLPGPYSFAGMLDNRAGETEPALIHRIGRLLADEARELADAGFRTFVVSDPLAVVRPPSGPSAASFEAAYRSIANAVPGASVIVWTYGADPRDAWPALEQLPVTAVAVDLTATEVDRLPAPPHRGPVGFGVVDPTTTLAEEPEELVRTVRQAAARRRATELWLGPGSPLDLLPAEPAEAKLGLLAQASHRLASEAAA